MTTRMIPREVLTVKTESKGDLDDQNEPEGGPDGQDGAKGEMEQQRGKPWRSGAARLRSNVAKR